MSEPCPPSLVPNSSSRSVNASRNSIIPWAGMAICERGPPRLTVFGHVVRVRWSERCVVIAEGRQMISELGRGRQGEKDLAAPSIRTDFCHLDEPAAPVLLHVQVEALRLDLQHLRGQFLLRLLALLARIEVAAAAPAQHTASVHLL
uniref:Uncharacterized protein n=1 Tax=Anopheles minimus TaxID=112268 RepID=A0A182VTB5_9DIPT